MLSFGIFNDILGFFIGYDATLWWRNEIRFL